MNLIVYNFRVDIADTDDLTAFNELLLSTIHCTPARSAIRFGRSIDGKPRRLKVIFHNRHDAIFVLRENKKFKKHIITIKNDQTRNQRLYLKFVQAELNTCISEGENDLTIRYVDNIPTIVPKNV